MKALFLALGATLMSSSQEIRGDEMVRLPINYKGSLNERSQEAIIVFRDWDTRACKPNAGKSCWDPGADSYLQDMKEKLPTITRFFRERHSGPPLLPHPSPDLESQARQGAQGQERPPALPRLHRQKICPL